MNIKNMLRYFACVLTVSLCLCGCNADSTDKENPAEKARNEVIEKWENEAGVLGTTRFIEDIYKEYPDDEVIANIYFYSIAKEQYEHYVDLEKMDYLESAKEYAAKIDPDYSDVYADEIMSFVELLYGSEDMEEIHEEAKDKEDTYIGLTNSDKKKICEYIQRRYDYYDSLNGGYSGDKYSDTIMQEAADKYNLTVSQVEIIWMNLYEY